MTLSAFNFHLLRVTLVQLLKAHGFDRSDNRALDVITDLCVKYLRLLTLTVLKYTELRNDTEPNVQDISNALIELKLISPAKRLDAFDIESLTSKGIENFENWFMSEMNSRLREVARPNPDFVKEVVHEKKMKDVNSKMSTLTAALDQQTQQAQQLNPTLPYQGQSSQVGSAQIKRGRKEVDAKDDDLTVDEDWIKFILRQQLNENPAVKFKGTVLIDYLPEDKKLPKRIKPCRDFVVVGPTPESLASALPYSEESKTLLADEEEEDDDDVRMHLDDNPAGSDISNNVDAPPSDYFPQMQMNDDTVEAGDPSVDHSLNLFG
ncbi:DEKNAAC103258 [Brettanomyces naardenensis]|uniref:DEKNAAC103258 n=1 Tax=Brettanomyces naardenensis TaxID=13370 RepID=A0A448YMQ6_BRENA|nr:DEKNAAC103258 [Brettanomyces naardenensis]